MCQCINETKLSIIKKTNRSKGRMKTKSIRARIGDAEIIEQVSRELAAELQRQVPVSEVVAELMECIENAKKRIKEKAIKTS